MKTHSLKCWPEFFEAMLKGEKTFDIRLNDRDFQVGDTVKMREYDPDTKEYTGRGMDFNIVYITKGLHGHLGVNVIVMQLEPAIEFVVALGDSMTIKSMMGNLERKNIKKCNARVTVDRKNEHIMFEITRILEQVK